MNEKLFRSILRILDPSIDVHKNQKIILDLAKLSGTPKDTFKEKLKSLLGATIPKESNITVEAEDANTLTLSVLPAEAKNEASNRTISITPAHYENIVSLQEKEHKVLTDTGRNIHKLEGEVKLSSTAQLMKKMDQIPFIRMYVTGDNKKTTIEKNAIRESMLNPSDFDKLLSEAANIKDLPLADRVLVIGLFDVPGDKMLKDYANANGFTDDYANVVNHIHELAAEMKAAKEAKKLQSAPPADQAAAPHSRPTPTASLKPLQQSDNIAPIQPAPKPKR